MTILPWDDLLKLGIAFLLGAAIGAEREYRRHPGGLRSLALVTVAACTFAHVIIAVGGNNIAAGIGALATGIGFLGAGVILHEGGQVRGLSTAASFWAAAAMGTAVGAGQLRMALALAGVILAAHFALRWISAWIEKHAPPADPGPR